MFNQGELQLQKIEGARSMAERMQQGMKDHIIPGAIPFIENQQMAILSSANSAGGIWVSALIT